MEKKQPGRKKIKLNDSETLDKIVALGSQGLTSGQIARCLGVSWSTIDRRRKEFGEIEEAIKKGEALGISRVANALYESATIDKNVTAQIFYLKNRSENWADRQEVVANFDLANLLSQAHGRILAPASDALELHSSIDSARGRTNVHPDERTHENAPGEARDDLDDPDGRTDGRTGGRADENPDDLTGGRA
jgi:hypothetical protein